MFSVGFRKENLARPGQGVHHRAQIALSYEAKLQGGFHRIDTLGRKVNRGALDFPVLLLRQVFKNRGSAGTLYRWQRLDGELTIKAYQKRWKVETFHKTLKGNAALASRRRRQSELKATTVSWLSTRG